MKSTLKSLWLTGVGLLAWLAVTPGAPTPGASTTVAAPRQPEAREVTVNDLNIQETKLREQIAKVTLRPSTRNPFRFGRTPVPAPQPSAAAAPIVAEPASQQPPFTLSGIATDGDKRTAIIAGEGQVYLVKEGESVAGRYIVTAVESDAATLRDESGQELRLSLR